MRKHGSALLRQASHVQHRASLTLQVRCHPQQLTDGDDTRATYTRNQDTERMLHGGDHRITKGKPLSCHHTRLGLA